jgi:hypothetical protein
MEAAISAKNAGHDVTVFEKENAQVANSTLLLFLHVKARFLIS